MKAVVTTGHGGFERLVYQDVPLPTPQPGEVLLQVLAAGINNTDINTRVGWYGAMADTSPDPARMGAAQSARSAAHADQASATPAPLGWQGATPFPLIQGADCCGRVVACASDVSHLTVGTRVLVRPCMRVAGFGSPETRWLGTDMPGAFAQYVTVPAGEVFPVHSTWSDAELATMPCAWGTALNMLHRAGVTAKDCVLVTGASGGVGSAVVQLARRRGATVLAVTTPAKQAALRALGADAVFDRDDDLLQRCSPWPVTVVVDNVAGSAFGTLLKLLQRGGRYVSSGAIAGPRVALDMRDLYLKDIRILGCTAWDEPVFADLIHAIEHNAVRPLLAASFALHDIALAQAQFLQKQHVGNMVLIP